MFLYSPTDTLLLLVIGVVAVIVWIVCEEWDRILDNRKENDDDT